MVGLSIHRAQRTSHSIKGNRKLLLELSPCPTQNSSEPSHGCYHLVVCFRVFLLLACGTKTVSLIKARGWGAFSTGLRKTQGSHCLFNKDEI
jgi:hypothetical protein